MKQAVVNKVQLFSVFLFSLTAVWVFLLFPYESVCKFLKNGLVSLANDYCIANPEKLNIVKEIVWKKFSDFILALYFRLYLKPKVFNID